ncbi:DUF6973 domain-containing protein [Velocimicrobium porci]|uniref:DUF6973 domain-containing protein n=1 Tax=Velocimicrobium porci TaxID=2606634 RepID=A0A6L5XWF1_9FIRM|nr:hypothetical protein [Velocimicrobium porci]MSS62751.1 hypothetical protein [Velocimicrobium porci]
MSNPHPYSSYLPTDKGLLNAEEKSLFAKHPTKGLYALSSAKTSMNYTSMYFKTNGYQDNSDAFRHSFWQALVAHTYENSFAKQWGDAHESTSIGIDKKMDLLNNEIGRTVGSTTNGNQAIEGRIAQKLLSMIANGKLYQIQNNKLVATDSTGRK